MRLYCKNLVKIYGKRTVVKGVSFEVNQGEIVGLLGPNGAGKTTSFYMITRFLQYKRIFYIISKSKSLVNSTTSG